MKDLYRYKMSEQLDEVSSEKDIGVVINTKLSFLDHLAEKINKVTKIVGLIRRTFAKGMLKHFFPICRILLFLNFIEFIA